MIEPKRIEYERDDLKAVVTVYPATALIGLRRTRISTQQAAIDEPDADRRLLRCALYPDLIACARVEIDGTETALDFDSFAALPEPLVIEWERAVYEVNPHWLVKAADEKKA